MQDTCKDVPQHGFGDGAGLDGVGFRPVEAKVEGVLSQRFYEPHPESKERPSKGGVLAPELFQNGEDLARGNDVLCSHGQHFLFGPALEYAEHPIEVSSVQIPPRICTYTVNQWGLIRVQIPPRNCTVHSTIGGLSGFKCAPATSRYRVNHLGLVRASSTTVLADT